MAGLPRWPVLFVSAWALVQDSVRRIPGLVGGHSQSGTSRHGLVASKLFIAVNFKLQF